MIGKYARRAMVMALAAFMIIPVFGAENLQRTYTSRDWEYQLTDMLARESGVVGTPGISPFPASGLLMVLERIDPSSLTWESQEDLARLKAHLSGDNEAVIFEYGSKTPSSVCPIIMQPRMPRACRIAESFLRVSCGSRSQNSSILKPSSAASSSIPSLY